MAYVEKAKSAVFLMIGQANQIWYVFIEFQEHKIW